MDRRTFMAGAAVTSAVLSSKLLAHVDVEPTVVDIGFCRDMSAHHVQALTMCQRVLGRETGGPVQAAASEVLENQAMEVGQMRAWLADWGASTAPPTIVMGWMGANNGEGIALADMPGYATAQELSELSTLQGRSRGRRWLELMRAHHVGGVMMANKAWQIASSEKVKRLAYGQARVQTFEITQYDLLLSGLYASTTNQ